MGFLLIMYFFVQSWWDVALLQQANATSSLQFNEELGWLS